MAGQSSGYCCSGTGRSFHSGAAEMLFLFFFSFFVSFFLYYFRSLSLSISVVYFDEHLGALLFAFFSLLAQKTLVEKYKIFPS